MRYIGIRHRIKKTKQGASRPTQVAIIDDEEAVHVLNLDDEDAEYDFLIGKFPIAYREIREGESLVEVFPSNENVEDEHVEEESLEDIQKRLVDRILYGDTRGVPDKIAPIAYRVIGEDASTTDVLSHHVRKRKRTNSNEVAFYVPSAYDGLEQGDIVAMSFGGSGGYLIYGLSERAEEIGASVFGIPPAVLAERRGDRPKDDDHLLLAALVRDESGIFLPVLPRDRETLRVEEERKRRHDIQKKLRIPCEQRLFQNVIGRVFMEKGYYRVGTIKQTYELEKANDELLKLLNDREVEATKRLQEAVRATDIWHEVFEPIKGCGEVLAAGLIGPIGNIRRFDVEPDQKAIGTLRAEAERLTQEADFEGDKHHITEAVCINPGTGRYSHFRALQRVAAWQRENGKTEQAALLDRAIGCYREIGKLKKKARRRRENKIVRYAGVHVNPDGTFPRNRRESEHPLRCSRIARQALYLLGDMQFKPRKLYEWALYHKKIAAALRGRHPEEVTTERGKKKYTDAHISRMAMWRTVTRFTERMARKWFRTVGRNNGKAAT